MSPSLMRTLMVLQIRPVVLPPIKRDEEDGPDPVAVVEESHDDAEDA
jgi:hypothetical protein